MKLLLNLHGIILAVVNELEHAWPELLAEAIAKARHSGRTDVADFLALRASNDLIRVAAVKWLFDSMIEVASRAQSSFPMLSIEREEPHSFRLRGADLTGSLLELRLGVRCLTLEAGWTRKPNDGFMRGGALAFAKLTHFGLPRHNIELLLLKTEASPSWNIAGTTEGDAPFDIANIEQQFELFIGG
ncbi:MAG TPA: hypothetical protein VJL58_03215 [Pyrinomonadaceae bacterium]|nr:hypothetical protein [Pyrinomonadaceae bacterium]